MVSYVHYNLTYVECVHDIFYVLSSQDVTLWMILCTIYMCVHLVTVFVASIDTSSFGVAREPPPSVAMHHPGGVLTTGE